MTLHLYFRFDCVRMNIHQQDERSDYCLKKNQPSFPMLKIPRAQVCTVASRGCASNLKIILTICDELYPQSKMRGVLYTERERARSSSQAMLTGAAGWHCVEWHSFIEWSKHSISKSHFERLRIELQKCNTYHFEAYQL